MPVASITIDTEFPDQPASDPLGVADELLELLARRRVRATFFVVGAWARANPERVRAIADAGHQIGNHSYSHCSLRRMTEDGIVEDLIACHTVLAELGVETRPWFRAPYGEVTHDPVEAEGAVKPEIEAAIERAGYRHIHWHARGEDWRVDRAAEDVAELALGDVDRRWPRPAIILFHSWPDSAPRALELVLDRLALKGAEFVTVDQLNRWRAGLGSIRSAATRLSPRK
jgi:peptidoglycan/xylan/chitin deacetylase (PgdA/CDA1 family)